MEIVRLPVVPKTRQEAIAELNNASFYGTESTLSIAARNAGIFLSPDEIENVVRGASNRLHAAVNTMNAPQNVSNNVILFRPRQKQF